MPYVLTMDKPLNEVAFTAGFLSQAEDEGMTATELDALVQMLAIDPQAGDLIKGSGGCRKVRLAGRGKGKSGGYRVVTFYAPPEMSAYVLAVLSKGSRANFNDAEVQAMAEVAKYILAQVRNRAAG